MIVTAELASDQRHGEAEARIGELMGVINTATAALVDVLAELDAEGLWQEAVGIVSFEHWIRWRCGVSSGRARRLAVAARRLRALPECAALFRAGSITEDAAVAIADRTPPSRDGDVAELAPHLMHRQLQRVLGSLPPDPDPADRDADETVPAGPQRRVAFGHRDDGWWWAQLLLPPDEGAQIQASWEAARDILFAEAHPDRDPDTDPGDISWADAAVRAADAALTSFATDCGGRPVDERYLVLVHVDVDTTVTNLHLGPALDHDLRRSLTCDTTLRLVYERDGRPVALGRSRRTVPRRIRRLIEHRDKGCRVPGCDQVRWLHAHHLQHWEHGGRTDPDNLCCLCPRHHRMHHQGRLDITGDPTRPDGLTFTHPTTGRRLEAAHPSPPGSPPTDASRRLGLPPPNWEPPTGEGLQDWAISWS